MEQTSALDELKTHTDLLLSRIRKNDQHAFNHLFEKSAGRLLSLIALKTSPQLKGRMDPEDVLQEVYMEVLRQFPSFEHAGQGSYYAWVAAITLNKIRNLEQRERAAKRNPARERRKPGPGKTDLPGVRPGELAADQTSPSQTVIRWETFDAISHALEKLAARDRQVINLRYLQGLSADQTALVLNMRKEKVNVLLFRALGRLRKQLRARPA